MPTKRTHIAESGGPRQSDPIDHHVGSRVRKRRIILGLSQERLSAQLGLAFQQLQKYESGRNRIGASRLYEISRLLGVPIEYFYDEMPGKLPDPLRPDLQNHEHGRTERLKQCSAQVDDQPLTREMLALIRAYYNIPAPAIRKKMLGLINSLATLEG